MQKSKQTTGQRKRMQTRQHPAQATKRIEGSWKQCKRDYCRLTALPQQHGVFRILGENSNGFNDRIGGNNKIAKALDIKGP